MLLTLLGYTSLRDLFTTVLGKSIVTFLLSWLPVAVVGFFGFVYNDPMAIYALMALSAVDFVTGVLKAAKLHTLNSRSLPRTVWKVAIQLFLVCVTYQLGTQGGLIGFAFGSTHFADVALFSFIMRELFSIVENRNVISPGTIPPKLSAYLVRIPDLDQVLIDFVKSKAAPDAVVTTTASTTIATSVTETPEATTAKVAIVSETAVTVQKEASIPNETPADTAPVPSAVG